MGFVSLLGEGEKDTFDELEVWDGVGFNLPPVDDYVFRINEMKNEKSQSSDQPTLITEVEIVSLADGSETPAAGQTVRDWRSLQPKKGCRQRVKSLMEACGVAYTDGGFDTDEFIGTEFIASVIHEENYQGKKDAEGNVYKNARIRQERPA